MLLSAARLYSTAWRAVVVLLTLEIAFVSLVRYFTDLAPPPPPVTANGFASPFLAIHVIGGVIALIIGPMQFVSAIRARWPRFHRITGRIYVAGCVVGAPTGLVLALGTTAGPIAGAGFAILAVLWSVFTGLGVRAAMQRRFDDHREWMLRSYAMTSTAITLRLMLPAAGFMGFEFYPAYTAIAWLSWTTNLILFEYIIRRTRDFGATHATLASA